MLWALIHSGITGPSWPCALHPPLPRRHRLLALLLELELVQELALELVLERLQHSALRPGLPPMRCSIEEIYIPSQRRRELLT